jgi:hypothetical protein
MVDKMPSWSTYNFAFNDPISLNDPTGAMPGYNDNGSSFDNWLQQEYANSGNSDAYYQQLKWQYEQQQQALQNYQQNMVLTNFFWNLTPKDKNQTYVNSKSENLSSLYYYTNASGSGIFTSEDKGSSVFTVGELYTSLGRGQSWDFGETLENLQGQNGGVANSGFDWSWGLDMGLGAAETNLGNIIKERYVIS